MGLNEQIRDAQKEIFEGLVSCENAISLLYTKYSGVFPEEEKFWLKLAEEEKGHSAMLVSLKGLLDEGYIFWELGRFHSSNMMDEIKEVKGAIKRARLGSISLLQAISMAIKIETCLLEASFYTTVSSSCPKFEHIAKVLTLATEKHLEDIKKKLVDVSSENIWKG